MPGAVWSKNPIGVRCVRIAEACKETSISPPKRLLVRRRRIFRNTVVGCFTVPTATGFFRTAARFLQKFSLRRENLEKAVALAEVRAARKRGRR